MHLILTTLLAFAVLDVEYPKKTDEHVNDFAKILSPDQVAVIKKAAGEVRTSKKIPIVVCTVQSLEDYGAHDWTIQRYAAALYSDWGIGDKDQNLGVLLFVSIEDRKLRIALGDGLSASFSEPSREIIERVIVPRFKKGDFGGGIVAGVQSIAERLGKPAGAPPPVRQGQQQPAPTPPAFRHPRAQVGEEAEWRVPGIATHLGGGLCGLMFLFVIGAVIVGAVRSVFRGGGRVMGGGYGGRRGGYYGGGYGGGGGSGWGGLLMGGLIGNMLTNMVSNRGGGGWSGGGSSGGGGGSGGGGWSDGGSGGSSSSGSDWGGGSSSSGGGFSSGGGASGEW